MADFLEPSNVFAPMAGQGGAQQPQQQGLLGLLMGLSKLGSNPLGLGATPQSQGFQTPQLRPTPQAPAMGGMPAQPPQFAPPIQPRVPNFNAVARLRQALGMQTADAGGGGWSNNPPMVPGSIPGYAGSRAGPGPITPGGMPSLRPQLGLPANDNVPSALTNPSLLAWYS